MSVIVTDTGFGPDNSSAAGKAGEIQVLPPDTDLSDLALSALPGIVAIPFASFADGRGFTLARRLRLMGYAGHLRARGHVLADQYAMARRAGFDDVEIDAALAARQPERQWLARADWRAHDYQARLRG